MSKTYEKKRLLELAGLETEKEKTNRVLIHDSYGNAFIQDMLMEDLAADMEAKKEEGGGEEKTEETGEDEGGDIGEEEEGTLSNADLTKGLKSGASAIADAVPNILNDEFAQIMNDVKDLAQDKQKIQKLMKYIEKLK